MTDRLLARMLGCCWLLTIVAATVAANTEPTTMVIVNHFDEQNACCRGSNVLNGSRCLEGRDFRLDCQKYMLDPSRNGEDKFHAGRHGLSLGDSVIENGKFCHVQMQEENTTRQVVMVCFEDNKHYMTLFLLKGSLALVSVVFILATMYVYYLLPDLRETQDKVTFCALACLFMFMLVLGLTQIVTPHAMGEACKPIGFMLYYFALAYFMWLNVIMWNVWKTSIMFKWKIKERYWYLLNHVYGWSVPFVLLGVLFYNREGNISEFSCFLERKATGLYLYIPMSVILAINVVLFFWSAWGIHATGKDVSPDKKRALAYKFRLYLKLIILAGVTWIFELLSFYYGDSNGVTFWLIADVMNALHGLGVFLVLVLWRRRIRKELGGKRILCFRTPASWAAEEADSEEGGLHADDKEPYDLINK